MILLRTFSNAPRFELLTDGTLYARAGVQTNCAGIAGIHVRITTKPTPGITFRIAIHEDEHADSFGPAVPGFAVPPSFQEAILRGARSAFDQCNIDVGLCFELLEALVHPLDAHERQFALAGMTVIREWLKLYTQGLLREMCNNCQE
jgi:hypothetical protein